MVSEQNLMLGMMKPYETLTTGIAWISFKMEQFDFDRLPPGASTQKITASNLSLDLKINNTGEKVCIEINNNDN